MPLRTRRWNDPVEPDDGYRVLVCRYRPRGVRKDDETWDAWLPNLGPSPELHAAYYGKGDPHRVPQPPRDGSRRAEPAGTRRERKRGAPIGWPEYRDRYLAEMRGRAWELSALKSMLSAGETVTLLCSSVCVDPARCHRTLLATLLD